MADLVNYKPTDYPQIPNAEAQYFTKEFRNISTAINSAEKAITSDESDITTLQADVTTINSNLSAIESAWTVYTPVVTAQTGAITSYAAVGKYKQIGKVVHIAVDVVLTSVGSAGGVAICSLPVATVGGNSTFCGSERAVNGSMLQGCIFDANNLFFLYYNNTGVFLSGSGANFFLSGTYEAV